MLLLADSSLPSVLHRHRCKNRRGAAERSPREYLTPEEVERLIAGAQKRVGARTPHRDATMILIAFRHGLRGSAAPTRSRAAAQRNGTVQPAYRNQRAAGNIRPYHLRHT